MKSMNKYLLVFLIISAALGIWFLGDGIAGMVVLDEHTRPLCEGNDECDNSVCCIFAGENAGVCHNEEMCSSIGLLTRIEAKQQGVMQYPNVETNLWFQTLTGILIIIMVGYSYYEYLRIKNERGAKS
jgi:hypothetical protein